jgi:DNA-nicking Smr family endonuclease
MARQALSREERALWRAAMRDVLPLGRRASPPPPPADEPPPATSAPPPDKVAGNRRPPARLPATPLPELVPATTHGVDRRTADRFRRGQMPIAARLDLHGMTQDEAHRALDRFLVQADEQGKRCVLVITGKGFRRAADRSDGVLRAAVPRWLNEAPNRARLLAVAPAAARDGGSGALYVLLRRRR